MLESPEHEHFEELAALSAGGHLSAEELREFHEHSVTCAECQQSEADFIFLVQHALPLTEGRVRRLFNLLRFKPPLGVRARFVRRARDKGIALSKDI